MQKTVQVNANGKDVDVTINEFTVGTIADVMEVVAQRMAKTGSETDKVELTLTALLGDYRTLVQLISPILTFKDTNVVFDNLPISSILSLIPHVQEVNSTFLELMGVGDIMDSLPEAMRTAIQKTK